MFLSSLFACTEFSFKLTFDYLPVFGLVLMLIFNFVALSIDKNMNAHKFRLCTRFMSFLMCTIFTVTDVMLRSYSYGFRGEYSTELIVHPYLQILICTFMLRCTFLESAIVVVLVFAKMIIDGVITGAYVCTILERLIFAVHFLTKHCFT